jgi:GNAT superfamily N-acetyltransferase
MIISVEDPGTDDAKQLLTELSRVLFELTGACGAASFDVSDVRHPRCLFVLARDSSGRPLGCGAFREINETTAELKRMYARPGTQGVGATILQFLEKSASELGYKTLWLETRRINKRATRFYTAHEYSPIQNFGKYVGRPEVICMGKTLAGGTSDHLG